MKIRCPHCETRIRLKGPRPYGKTIQTACPTCNHALRVKVPDRPKVNPSEGLGGFAHIFESIFNRDRPAA